MRQRKPRVLSPCVAERYNRRPNERIIEFSFSDGTGGLISFRQPDPERGLVGRVEVYRTDGKVSVSAPEDQP